MILSIDTSSSQGSWALTEGGQILDQATFGGRASASLLSSFQTSNSTFQTPGLILVGVGPGSFSGIRVAIATAQGLARVWGCNILPVRSSSALAWKHRHVSFLGIFADAKRGFYFFTGYELGKLTRPSCLIRKDEVEQHLDKCSLALSPDPLPGIPAHEAPPAVDLAFSYLHHGAETGLPLDPIYLHEAVVPKSA